LPVVSVDIHTVTEDTGKHIEIDKDICLKCIDVLTTATGNHE
jgi:hypothetical protein